MTPEESKLPAMSSTHAEMNAEIPDAVSHYGVDDPDAAPASAQASEPSDAMVDAYLTAQRAAVEEADRFGRPNAGGLHTNTVREACRSGLRAAIAQSVSDDICQACKGAGGTMTGGICAECYGQGTYSGAHEFVEAAQAPQPSAQAIKPARGYMGSTVDGGIDDHDVESSEPVNIIDLAQTYGAVLNDYAGTIDFEPHELERFAAGLATQAPQAPAAERFECPHGVDRFVRRCEKCERPVAQVVAVDPPGPDGHGVNWLKGRRPKPGDLLYAAPLASHAETAPQAPAGQGETDEQRLAFLLNANYARGKEDGFVAARAMLARQEAAALASMQPEAVPTAAQPSDVARAALKLLNATQHALSDFVANHRNPNAEDTVSTLLGLHDTAEALRIRRALASASPTDGERKG